MRNKIQLLFILLTIIIFSFPSICLSESKTVVGENCQIYLGDVKDKKELEKIRKSVRRESIRDGLRKVDEEDKEDYYVKDKCLHPIISELLEKIVVVSHTEKRRKICDKVKITLAPEVINRYFIDNGCRLSRRDILYGLYRTLGLGWVWEVDDVLTKKTDKIKIGLIIETKIRDIDEHKKETLENEEESQFHKMIEFNKDKYTVVDRKNLSKILEEQKLSSSGITDSETVKLGKILNLDIIVLRMIYEGSKVTKVLQVGTGEVLLFREYEETKGWIHFGETDNGDFYYDNRSVTYVSSKVIKVWEKLKYSKSGKENSIQSRKKKDRPIDGWDKLDFTVSLMEVDCINNTFKLIKMVDYDDQGKILQGGDFQYSSTEQPLPGTIGESLLRTVCPK